MSLKAIYPGTFDPVTNGHIDIIARAVNLFPSLIVAVADNKNKTPLFPRAQRIQWLQEALQAFSGIEVMAFDELMVTFARQHHVKVIVRGVRGVTDFDYECQLAGVNRQLAPELETIFLAPSAATHHIASTWVREIIHYGGDIRPWVPACVANRYRDAMKSA